MAFESTQRTVQRRAATDGAAPVHPGKRTLTEQLPARSGIVQAKTPGDAPAPALDARGQVIDHLLTSFQNIDVQVPAPGQPVGAGATIHVQAKAPYWNNKYVQEVDGERLAPPAGFDAAARTAQLPRLGIDLHSAVATGKARPEEIAEKVAAAIQAHLITAPPQSAAVDARSWASAWTAAIEAWLVRVGIGVDCNGFVYEALQDLVSAGAKSTGKAGGANGILDAYPTESLSRTNASIDQMVALGLPVKVPDDLQVADLMILPGSHVRIVMQVDRSQQASGITKFTTAESTADGRYGKGGAGAGPRIHFWRYAPRSSPSDLVLEHRYEGTPDQPDSYQASGESPVYKRHLAPAAADTAPGSAGSGHTRQRKAAGEAPAGPASAATGPGAPLPEATRSQMERSFGVGFGGVRVHQGDAAPAIGALAYADGEQLHFAPGRYQPGSRDGDALIGHELAHVVQQREGRVGAPQGKGAQVVDDPALEAEADRMGEAAAEGHPAGPHAGADAAPANGGRAVQRKGDKDPKTPGDSRALDQLPVDFDTGLQQVDALLTQRAAAQPVDDATFHAAVTALVQCCRATLPDPHQMQLYLASTASNADKTAIIGQMGDELARMEFMLGGLYNGAPSGKSWRLDAGSADLFPGTYLKAAEVDPSLDWCTSFAGYGYGRLGAPRSVTSEFGSGPKQREHGNIVFPQESWGILRELIAFRTDRGLTAQIAVDALVDAFLAGPGGVLDQLDGPDPDVPGRTRFQQYLINKGLHGLASGVSSRAIPVSLPAVGDFLILNPGGKAVGKGDQHTAMVDRFSGAVLTTIEGNLGDATGSRTLDLHAPDDLAQIYFLTRPAQQIADAHPAMAGTEAYAGAGAAQLQSLRAHNARIRAVFDKLSPGGSRGRTDPTPAR